MFFNYIDPLCVIWSLNTWRHWFVPYQNVVKWKPYWFWVLQSLASQYGQWQLTKNVHQLKRLPYGWCSSDSMFLWNGEMPIFVKINNQQNHVQVKSCQTLSVLQTQVLQKRRVTRVKYNERKRQKKCWRSFFCCINKIKERNKEKF